MQHKFRNFSASFTEKTKPTTNVPSLPIADVANEAWESDKTLFIFDTNILLQLYKFTDNEAEEFLNILHELSSKIWLPHQVGLEFYKNNDKIRKEAFIHKEFGFEKEKINQYIQYIKNFSNQLKNSEIESLSVQLEDLLQKFEEKLDNKYSNFKDNNCDDLLGKIENIFENKVGEPFSQDELNEIYKRGEVRYEYKIPPGFQDLSKKDGKFYFFQGNEYQSKFGDLILWEQIINKSQNKDIEYVIFVTDDNKKDWVIKKNDNIIPKYELIDEIKARANVKLFHIYNMTSFLESVKKFTNIQLTNETIKSIQQTYVLQRLEESFKRKDKTREIREMRLLRRSHDVYNDYDDYRELSDEELDELYEQELFGIAEEFNLNTREQAEVVLEWQEQAQIEFEK